MRDDFLDPGVPAKRPAPRGGHFFFPSIESRKALFFCLPPAGAWHVAIAGQADSGGRG